MSIQAFGPAALAPIGFNVVAVQVTREAERQEGQAVLQSVVLAGSGEGSPSPWKPEHLPTGAGRARWGPGSLPGSRRLGASFGDSEAEIEE